MDAATVFSPDEATWAELTAPILPDEAKAAQEVAEWAKNLPEVPWIPPAWWDGVLAHLNQILGTGQRTIFWDELFGDIPDDALDELPPGKARQELVKQCQANGWYVLLGDKKLGLAETHQIDALTVKLLAALVRRAETGRPSMRQRFTAMFEWMLLLAVAGWAAAFLWPGRSHMIQIASIIPVMVIGCGCLFGLGGYTLTNYCGVARESRAISKIFRRQFTVKDVNRDRLRNNIAVLGVFDEQYRRQHIGVDLEAGQVWDATESFRAGLINLECCDFQDRHGNERSLDENQWRPDTWPE